MNQADRSRRNFILQASRGIGAAVAASQLAGFTRAASAQDGHKINVALAGLGSLSTNQIAPALQKTEHARLAGIITGSPDKAERWQGEYGIAEANVYSYETMDRLRDNPDIDVVYVVTPNGLHAEHTIRAARAGKHVLCEKPMANTSAECEAMIAACDDAAVKLAIAYRCQFEPHHLECLRLAREREFGDLKIIEAGFGFRIGDPTQWRLRADLAGGGAIMDVGIYALQTCRMLTGEEPNLVTAVETKTDPVKFAEVDESVTWQMRFPSGVLAYCSTSYNVNGINRFRAYADRGWFGLEPAYNYGGLRGATSRGPMEIDNIDQFAAEIDDFARCIIEDRVSKVSGEEGLRDLRVIEAIYDSIDSGTAIEPGSRVGVSA
jgi:predicted dehydrogenase